MTHRTVTVTRYTVTHTQTQSVTHSLSCSLYYTNSKSHTETHSVSCIQAHADTLTFINPHSAFRLQPRASVCSPHSAVSPMVHLPGPGAGASPLCLLQLEDSASQAAFVFTLAPTLCVETLKTPPILGDQEQRIPMVWAAGSCGKPSSMGPAHGGANDRGQALQLRLCSQCLRFCPKRAMTGKRRPPGSLQPVSRPWLERPRARTTQGAAPAPATCRLRVP